MRHWVLFGNRNAIVTLAMVSLAFVFAATVGPTFASSEAPVLLGIRGNQHVTGQRPLLERGGQAQGPGLRIVVIDGENASNIIDQKTATAPVVEVRDRNDLPIVGASVTFMIRSGAGRAVLNNGLRQVTVTTNAAGRATVAINPLNRGAIQLQVNATYQGQTAAATTISQTNFATSQAATQAANTGAGAGGGGLSTTAIVGIVGAAAAGTAVAAKVASKAPECTFSVSSPTISASGNGSTATVNITVAPSDCEPQTWTVSSGSSFVTASPTSGTGSGSVTLTISPNTAGGAARTGTVTIAGQPVTISQAVPCTFTVAPTAYTAIPAAGGSLAVTVTVAPAGCSPATWSTSSASSFLTVSPANGSGSGTATIAVGANTVAGAAARNGSVTIAGRAVTVAQVGAAPPCNSTTQAGTDNPETHTFELGRTSGTFNFSYETYSQRDQMLVIYENRTLFDTSCVGTNGTRTQAISYSGSSTQVTIRVTPNCAGGTGTSWEFTVSCPR